MKQKGFKPAFERKIDALIQSEVIKFRGKTAETLKAELDLMPNFSVILM